MPTNLGGDGAYSEPDAAGPGSSVRPARHVTEHLHSWLQIVAYFYDGQLFSCFKVGQQYRNNLVGKAIFPHMDKHMGRIFTGAAATAPYSRWLLDFSMKMTERKVGKAVAEMAVA